MKRGPAVFEGKARGPHEEVSQQAQLDPNAGRGQSGPLRRYLGPATGTSADGREQPERVEGNRPVSLGLYCPPIINM